MGPLCRPLAAKGRAAGRLVHHGLHFGDPEEDLDVWMETKLDRVQSLVSPRSLAEDADADMWEDRIAKRP